MMFVVYSFRLYYVQYSICVRCTHIINVVTVMCIVCESVISIKHRAIVVIVHALQFVQLLNDGQISEWWFKLMMVKFSLMMVKC